MKYFITGGAGFIGSHLTERLLEQGDQVTVLDDLSTGAKKNIEALIAHPGFEIVEGTMLDKALVRKCMEGVDGFFHLGAALGV